jgi:hypothetical protein
VPAFQSSTKRLSTTASQRQLRNCRLSDALAFCQYSLSVAPSARRLVIPSAAVARGSAPVRLARLALDCGVRSTCGLSCAPHPPAHLRERISAVPCWSSCRPVAPPETRIVRPHSRHAIDDGEQVEGGGRPTRPIRVTTSPGRPRAFSMRSLAPAGPRRYLLAVILVQPAPSSWST